MRFTLVTLTVYGGDQVSTRTANIAVYKELIVNFSISSGSESIHSLIGFTSNSKPAADVITNYFWDFADGTTLK